MMIAISTLILLAGVVDDLRSRKVHNKLVLVLALIGAAATLFVSGPQGLLWGLLAASCAIILCLPLVVTHILGAGDMKLLAAFGLTVQWNSVLWVVVYSLFWGALLGVFRSILRGEGKLLLQNTLKIAGRQNIEAQTLQKIPYTVALLFGWLTHISLVQVTGGSL